MFSDMQWDMIQKAATFAKAAHAAVGQKRKYTGVPYFVHPEEVANLVLQHVYIPEWEQIAAAYLHDVVEDTQVPLSLIEREFGPQVASYVADLTDVSKPKDGNRAARKAIDLEHTKNASPQAKTVKLADLISNTRDIVVNDPDFAKVYMREKRETLKVLTEGDPVLYKMAKDFVNEYFKELEDVRS